MILEALCDFYLRDKNSVKKGWMKGNLSFLIVIDGKGQFNRIRRLDGEEKELIIPVGAHTNSVTPLLMWDNVMYALDYIKEVDKLVEEENTYNKANNREVKEKSQKKIKELKEKIDKAHKKHVAFVEKCCQTAERLNNPFIDAVVNFYKNGELTNVYKHELWKEVKKNQNYNVSFQVNIDEDSIIVATIPELVEDKISNDAIIGRCLITGKADVELVRIGTNTPITGCKSSAKLVSFQKDSGYDSYGKEQGMNAPISKDAEFMYSTALKKLTEIGSKHNVVFYKGKGRNEKDDKTKNRTYIFWASSTNSQLSSNVEDAVSYIINPTRRVDLVQNVFKSIWVEKNIPTNNKDRFCIAGLYGNSGRISVVYWNECSIEELAKNVIAHLEDMEIGKSNNENKSYRGLINILSAISENGDSGACPCNISEAVLKSILQYNPYPETMFLACLRRIRAESENPDKNKWKITKPRIAILKAYINRNIRDNNRKIETMLDEQNNNIGYLCGRLFAVLVAIQKAANEKETLVDNYMNAAVSTPSTVFPVVLKLSLHHSKKLGASSLPLKIHFEKLKKSIMGKFENNEFPKTLSLDDQGRFFIGYYHQQYCRNEEEKKEIEE